MPSIAIAIDSRCNARCAHCCFTCGPKSTEGLSDEKVRDLVAEAVANDDVDELGISGGEALLRRALVFEVIEQVHAAGKRVTLVTNGFWGQTLPKASRELRALKDAGLSSMTVSYDDFHAEYIPVKRIRNIFEANKRVELPTMLNVAVTRSSTGDALLAELGESVLRTRVTKFPVLPVGAARALPPDSIIREFRASDDLRCPGFEPVFHFDGKVYPCCSPAVFETALQLGDVADLSIAEAQNKVRHNLLLGVIRRFGFTPLLRACRAAGIPAPGDDEPLVDPCDLCRRLFRDEAAVRAIAPLVAEVFRTESAAEATEGADGHLVRR
ncbi:radical SAM protein [Cellulomonas hominis]|uniref:radical SAM protein n=1 Tax=Cellulomonas hominis TaxID=156981 RepID=UPI001B904670|nr:radical SAM protein [Cellulomonas hominis]VTR75291.1 hypothetical protein CHMI_00035 [Cellulomonas hominis]